MPKWIAILCGPVILAALISACGGEESEQISCVNSFDCPGALVCIDGWCAEDTGELPDDGNDDGYETDIVSDDDKYDSLYEADNADETDLEAGPDGGDEQVDDAAADTATDTAADEDVTTDTVTDTGTDEDVTTDTVTDTGTDTVVDTTADEDIVADTTPDVDTVVSGQTGAECSATELCTGSNVCGEAFQDQITNYCYLNCAAPNENICSGTSWPECVVIGGQALCLAQAVIVGNFTATVGSFVTTNNVSLTIAGTGNIQQACTAELNTSTNNWVLQCSRIVQTSPNKVQLDALFFWPSTAHAAGVVAGAYGQVSETTYNAGNQVIDTWIRAFFLQTDGSVTLTTADTATGGTVSGSLNFTGNAYDAQFLP